MRVSQATFYRQTSYEIISRRSDVFKYTEMSSTGVRVGKPSVDPVAFISNSISNMRLEEIDQYKTDVDHATTWLQNGEAALGSMSTLMTEMKTLAEQMATGTYDGTQREGAAAKAQSLLEQLVVLANYQVGGDYLFAGNRYDAPAATTNLASQNQSVALSQSVGALTTGRVYGTGQMDALTSRDITIHVDSVQTVPKPGGLEFYDRPDQITYSYVDDFGRDITHTYQIPATLGSGEENALDLGNGIKFYLDEGNYTAGDEFVLQVGRNRGNQENMDINLTWDTRLSYNYTLDDLFGPQSHDASAEGLSRYGNILDIISLWRDALIKDDKEQDYFETVPGVTNDPSTTGTMLVSGDWEDLKRHDVEFHVGEAFQALGDEELIERRQYRFEVVAPFSGVPSATNPMTVQYTWIDDLGNLQGPSLAVVTGTGVDEAVALDPPGEGTSLWVAGSTYDGGDIFGFNSRLDGPLHTDLDAATLAQRRFSFTVDENYAGGVPSLVNPMTLNYTWRDDTGVMHEDSVEFTGTGLAGSMVLADGSTLTLTDNQSFVPYQKMTLDSPQLGGPVRSISDDATVTDYRFRNMTVTATGGGGGFPVTVNVEYTDPGTGLPGVAPVVFAGYGPANAMTPVAGGPAIYLDEGVYEVGDAFELTTMYDTDTRPSSATPMPVTYTYTDDLGFRQYGEVILSGTGQDNMVSLAVEDKVISFGVSEDGGFDYGDTGNATLEQYNQAQDISQEFIPILEGFQQNLLKYTADAGARLNRLELRENLFGDTTLNLVDRLDRLEGADVPEVVSGLALAQTMYEAAIKATAAISGKSLADYL